MEYIMIDMINILEDIQIPLITDSDRYKHEDNNVARVTSVLHNMWQSDSLMKWSNYLGFKKQSYQTVLNHASEVGTIVHDSIESFLRTNVMPELPNIQEVNNAVNAFLSWYKYITSTTTFKVISMEQKLICQWFGGTYDLLAEIGGKICLIDFKTSSHIGEQYYMQLSAYRYMLRNIGIDIDVAMILQLSKKEEVYNQYILDLKNNPLHDKFLNDSFNAFVSFVNAYYYRNYITSQLNKLNIYN